MWGESAWHDTEISSVIIQDAWQCNESAEQESETKTETILAIPACN